jgi:hypothetical protein
LVFKRTAELKDPYSTKLRHGSIKFMTIFYATLVMVLFVDVLLLLLNESGEETMANNLFRASLIGVPVPTIGLSQPFLLSYVKSGNVEPRNLTKGGLV